MRTWMGLAVAGMAVTAAVVTSPPSAAEDRLPGEGTWELVASGLPALGASAIAPLPEGRFLVAGGESDEGPWLRDAYLVDVDTGGRTAVAPRHLAVGYARAVPLPDGRVGVFATEVGCGATTTSEFYDPHSDTWTLGPDAGQVGSAGAEVLPGGDVLLVGGSQGGFCPNPLGATAAAIVDTSTFDVDSVPTGAPHAAGATLRLPDGRVLVAGGSGAGGAVAELFDPETMAWSPTGPMVESQWWSVDRPLVAIDDTHVLAIPGHGPAGPSSHGQILDLSTGAWTATAPLSIHQQLFGAARLGDGSVLVHGVNGVAQVFVPATNSWRTTSSAPTASASRAFTLPGGDAIFFGGRELRRYRLGDEPLPVAPSRPVLRTAHSSPYNSGHVVMLRWDLPGPAAQGGRPVLAYELTSTGPGGSEVHVLGPGDSEHSDFDVAAEDRITYALVAINEVGRSEPVEVEVYVPADDTVAPVITITSPPPGTDLLVGQDVDAAYSCADPDGSGISYCVAGAVDPHGILAPFEDGQPIRTSVPGEYHVFVEAYDGFSNYTQAQVTYTVLPGSVATTVAGGETVSTGPEATPEVPVQTAVEVPDGASGQLTVAPRALDDVPPPPGGFQLLDVAVAIEGPPATPQAPYEVTFLVDGSALAGTAAEELVVFRDGVPVDWCAHATEAIPDPCVVSSAPVPGGDDVAVSVRTSRFSTWTLGIQTAPLATPDSYVVRQDSVLAVPATGVLANDRPTPSGGGLSATSLGGPAASRVALGADGSFTYTPPAGFVGTDEFTYVARQADGALSEPVTVTVSVVPKVATVLRVDPVVLVSRSPLGLNLLAAKARLTDAGGAPLAGRTVTFTAGGTRVCAAVTGADGVARCQYGLPSLAGVVLALGTTGSFAGDADHHGSTGRSGLIG